MTDKSRFIGSSFGRLVIISFLGGDRLLAKCSCGNDTRPLWSNVKSGRTASCGCGEHLGKGFDCKNNPTWNSWDNMKNRCNPNNVQHRESYKVPICDRWIGENGFKHFLEDLGPRPIGTTLERKDTRKGYSKQNCKWATKKEQQNNRLACKRVKNTGETVGQFAKRNGFTYMQAWHRLTRSDKLEPLYT